MGDVVINAGSAQVPSPPTYAGSRPNPYDGFGGYNFKAANTQRLRGSLAKVLAGSGSAEWAIIGDSTVVSSTTAGGAAQYFGTWPYYLRALQSVVPQANATDGWVRALDAVNVGEPRIAVAGGGWTGTFGTVLFGNVLNATATYTTGLGAGAAGGVAWTGTQAGVMYYDAADGTVFTISVNGAAAGAGFATVTCSGPAGWKVATPAAGFAAANNMQVKITTVGSSGAWIAGMYITNPNSLLIHNVGQSQTKASGSGSLSWSDSTQYSNPGGTWITPHKLGITRTDPDVVVISLGINDLNGGAATQAATIAAISNLAAQFSNSDIILNVQQAFAPAYYSDGTWTAFAGAMYSLADTLNVPLLDHRSLMGSYNNEVTQGWVTDSAGHFVTSANAMLARNAIKNLF